MESLRDLLKRAEAKLEFNEAEGATELCWRDERLSKVESAFMCANGINIMYLLRDRCAAEEKEAALTTEFFKALKLADAE